PPLPKPYEFVPLPEGKLPLQPPAGHHRYANDRLTGTLTATIIAHSSVHVASGLLEQTKNRDYPLVKGHFRTQGRLAIPATSLKGCIRSILEAISPSAVTITRARPLPRGAEASYELDKLDVAQRLFGTLGYQGQVRFSDALIEPEDTQPEIVPSVQLFRPRPESVDTYFEGRRARGRKFYMHGTLAGGDLPLEACPIGSNFALQMEFENMSAGELGLVLTALGLSEEAGKPRFYPKLGGAKPACLGTIEIAEVSLTGFAGAAVYTDFDATSQPLDVSALLAAAQREGLVLTAQLGRLAEVLRWPREERGCPDRNY
ncbi:MAG: RAMP superfamily CRISPR-associated protein, partial [Chloroflexales bacterium]|nr:RAMP superfamily CRISPR-associated protein [Chloroflexales bacterium]